MTKVSLCLLAVCVRVPVARKQPERSAHAAVRDGVAAPGRRGRASGVARSALASWRLPQGSGTVRDAQQGCPWPPP